MKIRVLAAALGGMLLLSGHTMAQVLILPDVGASKSVKASSWMAGAQIGHNWQSGSVVYGLEADISGLDLVNRFDTVLPRTFAPAATATTSSGIDWYGTVRGRLGWAAGPLMFYGTGGLAYGNTNVNSIIRDNFAPTVLTIQNSSVKAGWVAGIGMDYLVRPNLVLNVGYQYVDLGTTSLAAASAGNTLTQTVNVRHQFQVVSVGLSWLFAPSGGAAMVEGPKYAKAPFAKASPVSPAPWQGVYAGGHAGGAWGNRTDASYSVSDPIIASDARLKRDIVLLGHRPDGLGIYSYRYLWSETVHVGVMAQEVALIHPEAIVRNELDDYLRVDYSRLPPSPTSLLDWRTFYQPSSL